MARDPYASRVGGQAEIAERVDPVVWGAADGPLTARELEQFESRGFVVKERLFGKTDVTRMLEELERLAAFYAEQPTDEVVKEPETGTIRSVFRVHRSSPVFTAAATDPRLVEIAKQVLGSEVYIHQSRINFKRAFDGRAFPWHSDFETWHVEDGMPRMRALSASILLTENMPVNGPLMLIDGSHRVYVRCRGRTPEEHYKQSLREQRYGSPPPDLLTWLIDRGEITQVCAPAGSVVFFDSNTMHGSSQNMTPFPRHNLFFVYNSVHNALRAPYGGLPPRPSFLAERD